MELNVSLSAASACSTRLTKCAPFSGGPSGCSEKSWFATTQETWGNVPASASALIAAAMSSGVDPVLGTEPMPRCFSGLELAAPVNWLKYASALSPKLSEAFW